MVEEKTLIVLLIVYYYTKHRAVNTSQVFKETYFPQQNNSVIIKCLMKFGKKCRKKKLYNSNLFYDFAIDLSLNESLNSSEINKMRYSLSKYYFSVKNYEKSKQILNVLYNNEKFIDKTDNSFKIKLILNLAHVLFKLNHFEESEQKFIELIQTIEIENIDNVKQYEYLSKAFYFFGSIYSGRKFFDISIDLQLKSIKFQQNCREGDIYRKFKSFIRIACACTLLNRPNNELGLFWYQKALDCYDKMLIKGDNRVKKINLLKLNRDIGITYYYLNNFNEAIVWCDKNLVTVTLQKDKYVDEISKNLRNSCFNLIEKSFLNEDKSSFRKCLKVELDEDIHKICGDISDIINKYKSKEITFSETQNQITNCLRLDEFNIMLIVCKLKIFGDIYYYMNNISNASLIFGFALQLLESTTKFDYLNIFHLKNCINKCFKRFSIVSINQNNKKYMQLLFDSEKFLMDLKETLVNWDENQFLDKDKLLSDVYSQLALIFDHKNIKDKSLAFYFDSYECHSKCSKPNKWEMFWISKRIAELKRNNNDYESAHKWYKRANENLISLDSITSDYLYNISKINYEIGYFQLSYLFDYKNAIEWFEKNLNSIELYDVNNYFYENICEIIEKTKLYYGYCLYFENDINKAIEYIEPGLKIFMNTDVLLTSDKACFLKIYGDCLLRTDNFEKAKQVMNEANDYFDKIDGKTKLDELVHGQNYFQLGVCLEKISEDYSERVIECFERTVALCHNEYKPFKDRRNNFVLGSAHYKLAHKTTNNKISINHCNKAIIYFKKINYMKILSIIKIAESYVNLYKFESAIKQYSKALKLLTGIIENTRFGHILNDEKSINSFFDLFRDLIKRQGINELSDEIKNYYSSCVRISKFYLIKTQYNLGFCYISRLKQFYDEFIDLRYSFDYLSVAMAVFAYQSQNEETLHFVDKAIELLGSTLTGAYLLEFKSQYVDEAQAQIYLKSALNIWKSFGRQYSANVSALLFLLAKNTLKNNKIDEAIAFINEAKDFVKLPQQPIIIDNNFAQKENAYLLLLNAINSIDLNQLNEVLNKLNYKMILKNDIKYHDFIDQIQNIRLNDSISTINALVVVINCYGNKDVIQLFDEEKQTNANVLVEDVICQFDNNLCEYLNKVPKVLIFITQSLNSEENNVLKLEIPSVGTVKNSVKYIPLSNICILNIHSSNSITKNFDSILEIFGKSLVEQELTKILKNKEKLFINWEFNQRYIGWTEDVFLNQETGEKNRHKNLISLNRSEFQLSHKPNKRRAIIINNGMFDSYDKVRFGTGADIIYISSKLLELSYEIIFKTNLKGSEIIEFFEVFTRDNSLEDYDSVVVFILTHGGYNFIFGVDDEPVNLEDIFKLFSDNKCPYLCGKPKVFLINACRGNIEAIIEQNKEGFAVMNDRPDSSNQSNKEKYQFNDILIWYSSLNKYVSYRDPSNGSWFISAFLNVLNYFNNDIEILDSIKYVNQTLLKRSQTLNSLNPNGRTQLTEVEMRGWKLDFKF